MRSKYLFGDIDEIVRRPSGRVGAGDEETWDSNELLPFDQSIRSITCHERRFNSRKIGKLAQSFNPTMLSNLPPSTVNFTSSNMLCANINTIPSDFRLGSVVECQTRLNKSRFIQWNIYFAPLSSFLSKFNFITLKLCHNGHCRSKKTSMENFLLAHQNNYLDQSGTTNDLAHQHFSDTWNRTLNSSKKTLIFSEKREL